MRFQKVRGSPSTHSQSAKFVKNISLYNRKRDWWRFYFRPDLDEVNLWHIYQITSEGALQPKCPESNDQCIVGSNMRKVLFTIFLGAEEHLGEYLKNYTMKEVVDLINQER